MDFHCPIGAWRQASAMDRRVCVLPLTATQLASTLLLTLKVSPWFPEYQDQVLTILLRDILFRQDALYPAMSLLWEAGILSSDGLIGELTATLEWLHQSLRYETLVPD